MKILIMTDNPNIATGMATVGRNLALGLQKKGHEIHYLGWFSDPAIHDKMPFPLYTTRNQFYGADVFDTVIRKVQPDIVLTIGDEWMVNYISDWHRTKTRRMFKWVAYVPIDGHAYDGGLPHTWKATFEEMDFIIAYTSYGGKVIKTSLPSRNVFIIHHGVDTGVFHPINQDLTLRLRKSLGITDDVVFLVCARNQFRKNLPEICKGWKLFRQKNPNAKAKIWFHCWYHDEMGWDMDEVLDIYQMKQDTICFEDIAYGQTNVKLLPETDLNQLYNVSDVFLLQSGEGYGLPTLEAMACGKPVILLDHSANTEIGKGHGELVKVGSYMTGKHSTERPYPDTQDLADKIELLYKDAKLRELYGQAGLEWAKERDWKLIVDKWDKILQLIENPFKEKITMAEVT